MSVAVRLLIADDDPGFCALIAQSAPDWLEPIICASSEQAIALLRRDGTAPDVALVDLHMEPYLGDQAELEGLALADWIHDSRPGIPVILVSGSGSIDTSRPRSAVGFLRKPLDLGRFYRFLQAFGELFRASA